jgi:hypothetical protein
MKTFSATMEHLRWCRVEDVLRWVYEYSLGELLESRPAHETPWTIDIPCDQYTASVIMRASESIRAEKWKKCFYRITDEGRSYLAFWNDLDAFQDFSGSCAVELNTYHEHEQSEWTRDWVETVLKGMG